MMSQKHCQPKNPEAIPCSSGVLTPRETLLSLEQDVLSLIILDSGIYFRVLLAVIVANLLGGVPVWLLLVGAPSSGKSELICLFRKLLLCYEASTFTEASFLSGTPCKEKAAEATGGILMEIPNPGVILSKDFTSVLSMPLEAMKKVFALLREIYDGRVARALGVDGGKVLRWSGKIGFIGGVTEVIYTHRRLFEPMGERFLTLQMQTSLNLCEKQAEQALLRDGSENQLREEIMETISAFLDEVLRTKGNPPVIPRVVLDRLTALSVFVATSRTHIERDGKSREVTQKSSPEGPARLAQVFKNLYLGLLMTGNTPGESWAMITEVAFCSISDLRRRILLFLYEGAENTTTDSVKRFSALGWGTVARALEDLEILCQIRTEVTSQGTNSWRLTDSCRRALDIILAPFEDNLSQDASDTSPGVQQIQESLEDGVIPEDPCQTSTCSEAYPDLSPLGLDQTNPNNQTLFDCIVPEAAIERKNKKGA